MKWRDLVSKVAARAEVGAPQTRVVLDALIEEVLDALGRGEPVAIPGVVKLESRWQEARTVRSVQNRRRVSLDGRYVPRVRAGLRAKRVLASRTPQTWRDPAHQAAWQLAETLIGDLALYHADRVPAGLTPVMAPDEIENRCASSFGSAWSLVRDTFDTAVSAAIRDQQPHLPIAARRRWACS